jgi:hypothetical protein
MDYLQIPHARSFLAMLDANIVRYGLVLLVYDTCPIYVWDLRRRELPMPSGSKRNAGQKLFSALFLGLRLCRISELTRC